MTVTLAITLQIRVLIFFSNAILLISKTIVNLILVSEEHNFFITLSAFHYLMVPFKSTFNVSKLGTVHFDNSAVTARL